ncbi:MAG: molybdopterin molybdotransferase [Gaiellales bacterium]|jgi:molybdopterin molybdotransferase|nr:molybdopterin molybdotransferase [Gaiellales bacterium]
MDDARALLLARLSPLPAETLALTSALAGRVLAADVRAAHDLPPFDNSAMDGFAVRAEDAGHELPVKGGSFAGDDPVRLAPRTAMTVATGAPLPPGADTVVPIERAHVDGDRVSFSGPTGVGDHVRRRGTDVATGAVVVSAGNLLRPLALAAIATGGVAELSCHRRPRVCVVVTGDELVAPGEPLRHGQIHESNSILIAARCEQAGAEVVAVERVPDDAEATRAALERALATADVVVTSGGVSVGTRDHVKPALSALAVEQLFWRIAVQPGRPTWCGLRDGRVVVGLPGNPLSVMVGLELLLVPALRRLAGASDPGPPTFRMPLTSALRRDSDRERVRPVRLVAEGAEPLGADLSHQLGRAAIADALALVPSGSGELAAGSLADLVDLR